MPKAPPSTVGFIRFNAVLGALATYVIVAADLRLAALAALFSTWIFSYISRDVSAPALAWGFVFTVWLILLIGWLNPRFNSELIKRNAEA